MSPARPSASPTSPFRFFHVTVAAIRDVTPSMRRFTFIGDELVHYADPGWDQRIKLVLPPNEAARGAPVLDPHLHAPFGSPRRVGPR